MGRICLKIRPNHDALLCQTAELLGQHFERDPIDGILQFIETNTSKDKQEPDDARVPAAAQKSFSTGNPIKGSLTLHMQPLPAKGMHHLQTRKHVHALLGNTVHCTGTAVYQLFQKPGRDEFRETFCKRRTVHALPQSLSQFLKGSRLLLIASQENSHFIL